MDERVQITMGSGETMEDITITILPDGSGMLEIVHQPIRNFVERLTVALKYVFGFRGLQAASMFVSEENMVKLRDGINNIWRNSHVRENG